MGSVLISFAAIILLATAFGARFYSGPVFAVLLGLVLLALCVSIALHVQFLRLTNSEHRETVGVLDSTEQEYKSVFDSTLDGILILDDDAVCLDANPAVLTLLGTDREQLVGRSIGRFFAVTEDFREAWARFLDRKSEHRETRFVRADGETIFVEYTANAYYLPGRHVVVVRNITRRRQAEEALRESEQRFRQMASNIQEIFWMLDAEHMTVLYVSPAYETVTGRTCESLEQDPKSYEEVIHPEDRVRVLSRLRESRETGRFDEEFRIIRTDAVTRWVWVRGFPVRDSAGIVRRLVGTAQDISARKSAEEQMARNLDVAEAARAEAEAFRRTSLALTQNLRMDDVLDTLLQSLLRLVPAESAQILLVEAGTRLFLAREAQNSESNCPITKFSLTLDAKDNPFLLDILMTGNSLLISDTAALTDSGGAGAFSHLRSWLCVPLIASDQMLGVLSLGDASEQAFTKEHLRLAKSLAIPAAVAIQNARLYERAEIFRAELEQGLADVEQAGQALREARPGRGPS